MHRFFKLLSLIPIAALTDCGRSNLDCADQTVKNTIVQIAKEPLSKHPGFSVIDIAATRIDILSIRTNLANERRAECSGHLKYDFVWKGPDGKPLAVDQSMKRQLENEVSAPVNYTAERTDDGEIYVSVSGLRLH